MALTNAEHQALWRQRREQYIKELEQKIAERTAALERKNAERAAAAKDAPPKQQQLEMVEMAEEAEEAEEAREKIEVLRSGQTDEELKRLRHLKTIRFHEPIREEGQLPCVVFEYIGETKHFWKYLDSGKPERAAKSYLANIDQGMGRTGMGRFRGDAREDSTAHFEPCPHCPDFEGEIDAEQAGRQP